MQQHSGQHLISAVLEQDCNWPTVSWYMGADTSFVRLGARNCDSVRLAAAEQRINELIADGCAMQAAASEDDVSLRIVTIAGIDRNPCCGTHVSDIVQLQSVQFLHTEPAKGGDDTLLHFRVGGRVQRYAGLAYARERHLNVLLGGEAAVHAELVQKVQERLRQAQRQVRRLQKELAATEARAVNEASGRWHFVHRRDGVADGTAYVQAVLAAVRRKDVLVVGTAGEEQNWAAAGGKLMVQGVAVDVERLGPELCEMLGGKGAGKGGRYQAKVNSFGRLSDCEAKVVEYFGQLKLAE